MRRRQCDERMKEVERKAFMSINDFIGWLGITASTLCESYSIHLPQNIRFCHHDKHDVS